MPKPSSPAGAAPGDPAEAGRPVPQESSGARSHAFQAETRKLLDMMVHHLYARREVFLRELISNSSDAIDKQRLLDLVATPEAAGEAAYQIVLRPDAAAGTLTIEDDGIGMSEEELVENLGTIARSGSEAYRDEAGARGQDAGGIIGQFGVGFYSVFMVADQIVVQSQRAGLDQAWEWRSEGGDAFEMRPIAPRARGTSISLRLRREAPQAADDAAEPGGSDARQDLRSPAEAFTDPATLRQVVKRYSDFIAFPVVLVLPPEADGGPERRETLNSMRPLWTRRPGEVEPSAYSEFYHHLSHDWTDPFAVIHQQVEGLREYTALLFLPAKPPMDLFSREHRRGLQLFARRVFIMEECRELMPEYLRFVRGLVDSPDLPLNVSRESIQEDRMLAAMRRQLTRRVLTELQDKMAADRAAYEAFWEGFGAVVKEGFHYEPQQASRLRDLCLFRSTAGEGWTSLAEYRSRMVDGQTAVYFLPGERLDALRAAPQLEGLQRRGVEVLFFTDPVDEILVSQLPGDGDPPLTSVAQGELDLGGLAGDGEPAPEGEASAGHLAPLLELLTTALPDEISQARASHRLTDSAVCMVDAPDAPSPQLVQILRAMGQEPPESRRILEVNPAHPLIQRMLVRQQVSPDDDTLRGYARLLYDLALLAEGKAPPDGARLAGELARVMTAAMG